MHAAQKFALGLLAAAAVATASDVVQLKKDTFDDFVKANDLVLAECEWLTALSPVTRILMGCV
jgi:protein disulfide-isomerase A1